MPPLDYIEFYFYANLAVVNELRVAVGMERVPFLPYTSRKQRGAAAQMAVAFLLGDQITNAMAFTNQPVLQYLFFLAQINVSCSPITERGTAAFGDNTLATHPVRRKMALFPSAPTIVI